MPKRIKYLTVVVSVALLLGGFFAGRYVQADVASQAEPGTSLDPLVTQSYVDSQLKAQIQTLQNQITVLQNRVAALEARQAGVTSSPVVNTPAANPSTTPSTPSTQPVPNTAIKKVYPKKSGTTINVRSGAGTNFTVIAKVSSSNPGIYLSEKNSWCYIKLSNGKFGWVSKEVIVVK